MNLLLQFWATLSSAFSIKLLHHPLEKSFQGRVATAYCNEIVRRSNQTESGHFLQLSKYYWEPTCADCALSAGMEEGRSDGVSIQIGMGKKREGHQEEPHHHRAFLCVVAFNLLLFFHLTTNTTERLLCLRVIRDKRWSFLKTHFL